MKYVTAERTLFLHVVGQITKVMCKGCNGYESSSVGAGKEIKAIAAQSPLHPFAFTSDLSPVKLGFNEPCTLVLKH